MENESGNRRIKKSTFCNHFRAIFLIRDLLPTYPSNVHVEALLRTKVLDSKDTILKFEIFTRKILRLAFKNKNCHETLIFISMRRAI